MENRRFEKIESKLGLAPLGKLLFIDEEKQKEWDSIDPDLKKDVLSHLHRYTNEMCAFSSIEVLCHAYNELSKRIDELEKNNEK